MRHCDSPEVRRADGAPGSMARHTGQGYRRSVDKSTPGVTVRVATEVTPQLVAALSRLIPQLSRSSPPPDAGELGEMIASPATELLVASGAAGATSTGDDVLGVLTLVVFRIPTGVRAWIEDVVVDAAARGRGVGDALNRFAIERATDRGAKTVDLTSRPSREAANRLYRRIGFVERETNIYRLPLSS